MTAIEAALLWPREESNLRAQIQSRNSSAEGGSDGAKLAATIAVWRCGAAMGVFAPTLVPPHVRQPAALRVQLEERDTRWLG